MVEIEVTELKGEKYGAAFLPGQVMKGTVQVKLKNNKNINGLYLLVRGVSNCKWNYVKSNTKSTLIETNHNREDKSCFSRCCVDERRRNHTDFFSSRIVLVENNVTLHGRGALKAGVHRFNFECVLPPELPASYEAKFGSIRYEIEIKMDIPMAIDEKSKILFPVVRKEDLNNDPKMRNAIHGVKESTFWHFPCSSEPFQMKLTVPQTGWAAGELIKINVDYENKSSVTISSTHVMLRQVITYIGEEPYPMQTVEKLTVCRIELLGCRSKARITREGRLKIPAILVPSTSIECSGCLKIEYELKIEAISDGFHGNVSVRSPLTIGSIPLVHESEFNSVRRAPLANASDDFPHPTAPVIHSQLLNANDMPPPSFEDAMSAHGANMPSVPY